MSGSLNKLGGKTEAFLTEEEGDLFWLGVVAKGKLMESYCLPFRSSQSLSGQRIKGSEVYQQTDEGLGGEKPREHSVLEVVTEQTSTCLLESSPEGETETAKQTGVLGKERCAWLLMSGCGLVRRWQGGRSSQGKIKRPEGARSQGVL